MSSTVVLLSGGIDSATLAARLHAYGALAATLFVDYGQPAAVDEATTARKLAGLWGAPHHETTIRLALGRMGDGSGVGGPRVVPGRNLVLIGHGVNLALSIGAQAVALGATLDDAAEYVDCRPTFAEHVDRVCAALLGVRVRYPFAARSKAEVVTEARRLGLDLASTWSCYSPRDGRPCGGCNSCRQRTAVLRAERRKERSIL